MAFAVFSTMKLMDVESQQTCLQRVMLGNSSAEKQHKNQTIMLI